MNYNKKNIDRFFSINPTIYNLLNDAENPLMAKNFLKVYIDEMINILHRNNRTIQPLEWSLQMNCLQTFRRIISVRSQKLTKFNIVKLLWHLAKENIKKLPDDLNDGFFEEMSRLFAGMLGKSGIYNDDMIAGNVRLKGRDAAIDRSERLDEMALKAQKIIRKYKCGLDESIIKLRQENKKRILNYFKATDAEWNDYLWQIRHVIRDAKKLGELVELTGEEIKAIELARSNNLPFGITPYYVSLMDKTPERTADHAIRAQVIPPLDYVETIIACKQDPSYSFDFMLENNTSPVDIVTRRYPMIIIIKPYNTCSQICVYCQRNWEINDVLVPHALASTAKIDRAIEWVKEHKAVTEVLVTGGDPLVMKDDKINEILAKLSAIKHVERIRIGSRTPVVLPQRITNELINTIAHYHQPGKREIILITHFEHSYEITPQAMQAVQKFKTRGMSVYNQAVFTVENSRRFELVALRNKLRLIGVDPYYTFNTKGKEETKKYRVPLARLQQETKEEARLMPGTVRTDEPVYNVPGLGKNYIKAQQHHSLLTILPNGKRVYEFHPWEKYLSLSNTFIDIDVSIYDYLQEMKKRGENIKDYQSIWYYY
ncbi:MAG TPA: KamA family radical SAM protein [bacterium]|nr:KamA family radical SAM protein [bacterium]HPN45409.1 KamA family radical SAM protein [bacterium]